MRDFSKSLMSFSWAMSLFGLRQFTNLLAPPAPGQTTSPTTDAFRNVAGAVEEQLGQSMSSLFRAGDRLQQEMIDNFFRLLMPTGAMSGAMPSTGRRQLLAGAMTDPRDQIIIRYTRGTGRFSSDKRYIALNMTMYNLQGQQDGEHHGVWQRLFDQPSDLFARPGVPVGPFTQPQGPVEHVPVAANTKAIWIFGDRSSIMASGPASSHLIPLSDGSFQFLVSTAQIITGGTGRYSGAYGLTQSLGTTHVPQGTDLFGPGDATFSAMTLDTFRVVDTRSFAASRQPPRPPGAIVPPPPGPAVYSMPGGPPQNGGRARPMPARQPPSNPQPSGTLPFASHFATIEGSRMHYLDEGSGDPILFLHGNPTWCYVWRNILPALIPLGRCIAPDLIGMGKSDKPAIDYRFTDHVKYLEGLIRQLGLRNITLVMYDWGTALGFNYAMHNPDNVRGLAFFEAMVKPYRGWEDFPESVRDQFKAFREPDKGMQLIGLQNVFIEQLLPKTVIRPLSAEEMDAYRMPFRDPSSRIPIWRFTHELPIADCPRDVANAVAEYSRKLKESRLPKLLLTATPGTIATEADIRWCKQNLKKLIVADVGPALHLYQEDCPTKLGGELAKWYRRLNQIQACEEEDR